MASREVGGRGGIRLAAAAVSFPASAAFAIFPVKTAKPPALFRLTRHVADIDLLRLLGQFLEAGAFTSGNFFRSRRQGLVQGSALSPLLRNLALHPLDLALRDLSDATHRGVACLRYADDLLVLARDAGLAGRAVGCIRTALGRLQQSLRRPTDRPAPAEQGVDWLGVRLQPRPQRWAGRTVFGYVVPDAKVVAMLGRLTEMTAPPSERIDAGAFNLARWIVSINDQLRDWRQAYLFADNGHEVFRALDEHCLERVGGLIQSVTGVRRAALQQYRTRLPRGFWTWQVPGARLSVLSSLTPHWPANLVRRPAWMRPPAAEAAPPPAPAAPPPPTPPPTDPDPAAE